MIRLAFLLGLLLPILFAFHQALGCPSAAAEAAERSPPSADDQGRRGIRSVGAHRALSRALAVSPDVRRLFAETSVFADRLARALSEPSVSRGSDNR